MEVTWRSTRKTLPTSLTRDQRRGSVAFAAYEDTVRLASAGLFCLVVENAAV
jgi:hypothetical protein